MNLFSKTDLGRNISIIIIILFYIYFRIEQILPMLISLKIRIIIVGEEKHKYEMGRDQELPNNGGFELQALVWMHDILNILFSTSVHWKDLEPLSPESMSISNMLRSYFLNSIPILKDTGSFEEMLDTRAEAGNNLTIVHIFVL